MLSEKLLCASRTARQEHFVVFGWTATSNDPPEARQNEEWHDRAAFGPQTTQSSRVAVDLCVDPRSGSASFICLQGRFRMAASRDTLPSRWSCRSVSKRLYCELPTRPSESSIQLKGGPIQRSPCATRLRASNRAATLP